MLKKKSSKEKLSPKKPETKKVEAKPVVKKAKLDLDVSKYIKPAVKVAIDPASYADYLSVLSGKRIRENTTKYDKEIAELGKKIAQLKAEKVANDAGKKPA